MIGYSVTLFQNPHPYQSEFTPIPIMMSARFLLSLLSVVGFLCYGNAWAPTLTYSIPPSALVRSNVGSHVVEAASPRRPYSRVFMSAVEAELVTLENQVPNFRSEPKPPHDDELQLELKDKIINGVFLSAAFGYALYTIFSIDQGLTRGWTAR